LVSVIIPHLRGEILSSCLASVYAHTKGFPMEVIVIDDGNGADGSVARAQKRFPAVQVASTTGRRGYGTCCNVGFTLCKGRYVVFLNNDVEVTAGWLEPLLSAAESDASVAICQPKMLSMADRSRFDLGGGAGGELDYFGYPFSRGTLLYKTEKDAGQYDSASDIFWANGAAMFARADALRRIGLFDEEYYMQIEEIDLCWRAHMKGYRVRSVPQSVIYHHGGWTLPFGSLEKQYLSHRNSLILLLKNLSLPRLLVIAPVRLVFELLICLYGLFVLRQWRRSVGILFGVCWILFHPFAILRRRKQAQSNRSQSDGRVFRRIYGGSIFFAHLFKGVRTAAELVKGGRGPVKADVLLNQLIRMSEASMATVGEKFSQN
jgi:GT2 family glycosyltransferase